MQTGSHLDSRPTPWILWEFAGSECGRAGSAAAPGTRGVTRSTGGLPAMPGSSVQTGRLQAPPPGQPHAEILQN